MVKSVKQGEIVCLYLAHTTDLEREWRANLNTQPSRTDIRRDFQSLPTWARK
jgi:hypothetical protein